MNQPQAVPHNQLSLQQQRVLALVMDFYRVTGEGCSASYVSRRLSLHHSTAQQHFSVLHRKGWLRSDRGPAVPFLQR